METVSGTQAYAPTLGALYLPSLNFKSVYPENFNINGSFSLSFIKNLERNCCKSFSAKYGWDAAVGCTVYNGLVHCPTSTRSIYWQRCKPPLRVSLFKQQAVCNRIVPDQLICSSSRAGQGRALSFLTCLR